MAASAGRRKRGWLLQGLCRPSSRCKHKGNDGHDWARREGLANAFIELPAPPRQRSLRAYVRATSVWT